MGEEGIADYVGKESAAYGTPPSLAFGLGDAPLHPAARAAADAGLRCSLHDSVVMFQTGPFQVKCIDMAVDDPFEI